eukprot:2164325-Prymnesium_polylepis.2
MGSSVTKYLKKLNIPRRSLAPALARVMGAAARACIESMKGAAHDPARRRTVPTKCGGSARGPAPARARRPKEHVRGLY